MVKEGNGEIACGLRGEFQVDLRVWKHYWMVIKAAPVVLAAVECT